MIQMAQVKRFLRSAFMSSFLKYSFVATAILLLFLFVILPAPLGAPFVWLPFSISIVCLRMIPLFSIDYSNVNFNPDWSVAVSSIPYVSPDLAALLYFVLFFNYFTISSFHSLACFDCQINFLKCSFALCWYTCEYS